MRSLKKIIILLFVFIEAMQNSFSQTKIVYASDSLGTYDIYDINPDGTGRKILLNSAYTENAPKWTPDGTKIYFVGDKDGSYDIYRMDASGISEGSGLYAEKITNTTGDVLDYFSFSPDGSQLVYTYHDKVAGTYNLYLLDIATLGSTQITFNDTMKQCPFWTYDGNFIVYEQAMNPSGPVGNWQLFAIHPDGTNLTRLTSDGEDNRDPVVSPNGDKILFISTRNGNLYCDKLWIGDFVVTGGIPSIVNDHMLVTSGRHQRPAWSPTGDTIVFGNNASSCTWDVDLYTVKPDGTGLTRLTANPHCSAPDWSQVPPGPPSQNIIFDEQFDNLDAWSPAPDNGDGCTWTVVNGAAKIGTMGYNPSGWIGAVYERPLPQTIPPGVDFILKAHIVVMDGDPSGWLSGVGVQLMDDDNNRVVRINFNDSQASSGYGGLQYSTGLGMVYTNDPGGFSTNNPTLDGVLEIRRTGTTWTAYLDGQQLGSPQEFDVQRTATKVQITNGQYQTYHYRDGEIDYIMIELPTPPSGLTCFYAIEPTTDLITKALSELGFSTTFAPTWTWPADLSSYNLVVCRSYSMCTPTYAPLVGDYVSNGGNALLLTGTPSTFGGGGYSCSNIADWFGTADYANASYCVAKISYDHPLGTNLLAGDTVAIINGVGAAGVTNVFNDCDVLSTYTTGVVHSFVRVSGAGKVGYNGEFSANKAETYTLVKSMISWLTGNLSIYLLVSPQTATVNANSGSVTFSVNSNVNWSVTDNAGWLTVSKTNDTTITANYQANNLINQRVATITVSGPGVTPKSIQVTQEGAAPFLSVTPDTALVGSASGSFNFSVSSNIQWNISGDAGWITVTKNDTTNFNVNYQENSTIFSRTATIIVTGNGVSDQYVKLIQQGGTPSISVSPSSVNVTSQIDTAIFMVDANISWIVTSTATWITLQKTDSVSFMVISEENTSVDSRTANITVSGDTLVSQTVTCMQAGADPLLEVTPTELNVSSRYGDTIVLVHANIAWSVSSSAAWLNVTKISNDSILVHYNENTSTQGRSEIITVNGYNGTSIIPVNITLSQAGTDPYIYTADTSYIISSKAGYINIGVQSNVNWTATSSDSWLDAVKKDALTLEVNYSQNTGLSSREGTILLGGPGVPSMTIHILQNGVDPSLIVSPGSFNVDANAGDTLLDVNATVTWNVSSNKSWVTVTKQDTSTVLITFGDNVSTEERKATITVYGDSIATQYVSFTQSGAIPVLSVSPANILVSEEQGDTTVNVSSNVDWQYFSSADWIGMSKPDSLHLLVSFDKNPYTIERNAIIVISGANVSSQFINITQQAAVPFVSIDSTSLHLHSTSGNVSLNVQSNVDWSVSDNSNWLTVSKVNATTLNIQYTENPSTTSRTAIISVKGTNVSSLNLQVMQEGATPFLNISTAYISVPSSQGDTVIEVSTNIDWSVKSLSEWITCMKSGSGILTINYEENGEVLVREGKILLTGPGVDSLWITCSQAKADPYVLPSASQIFLPYYEMDTVLFVHSNISWNISSETSWLNIVKIDSVSFQLHCAANRSTQTRSGEVYIGGDGLEPVALDIVQDGGLPYLYADRDVDTVSAEAGTVNFKISSNVSWKVTTSSNWLDPVKTDSNTLKVNYLINTTGVSRTAYVYVTGTGTDNLILTLMQDPMKKDLSVEWISPESSPECGTYTNQEIKVRITNLGTEPVSGFYVGYKIEKSKTQVKESLYKTIMPGDVMVYLFENKANMGSPGQYKCKAWVALKGDQNRLNDTAYITILNQPIIISAETTETVCNDTTGGIFIKDINGGIPPYRVFWTIGDTVNTFVWDIDSSNKINNVPSGDYIISVNDTRGCDNQIKVSVKDAGGPSIAAHHEKDVTCAGGSDGAIDISVYGGSTPYSYYWSNGEITEDIYNLSAGIYSLEIRDSKGCKTYFTDTIEEKNPISVTALVNDANCGVNNGSIGLEVSGGYSPFSYLWSTGDTVPNPDSLYSGIYTVEVTDSAGCTAEQTVTIYEVGAPVIGLTESKPADCGLSNGKLAISINGDTVDVYSKYIILWSTGDTTRIITDLQRGIYTVSVKERYGSCTAIEQFEVISNKVAPPEICMVTVDSILERNKIVIHLPVDTVWQYYNIYREGNQINVFDQIAQIKVSEGNSYIDSTSNPRVKPWKYRVSATDKCGNETDLSMPHKTIHLLANQGINGEINLLWTGYYGFEYSTYYIYRYSEQGKDTIAEVAGQTGIGETYSDLNPPVGWNDYFVEVRTPFLCETTTKTSHNSVRSNHKKLEVSKVNGVYDKDFKKNTFSLGIYPNPSSGDFYMSYRLSKPETFLVRIIDIHGRLLFQKRIVGMTGLQQEAFHVDLYPGMYQLQVVTKYNVINKSFIIEQH